MPWGFTLIFPSCAGEQRDLTGNTWTLIHILALRYQATSHYWNCCWPKLWPWWRHQMETFSALLAICAGNSPVPSEFPTQRPVTLSLMFSLICARINGWVNNGEAGDLRWHRAHYDIIVMRHVASRGRNGFKHRKMVVILQAFAIAFSWMNSIIDILKLHCLHF